MESTTKRFLEHLATNGPQTRQQLEALPFWGGIRTRIPVLVRQGRVIKCEVANPNADQKYAHFVVQALKVPAGVFTGNIRSLEKEKKQLKDAENKAARARAKIEETLKAAKNLLEQNGYTVTPNRDS